MRLPLAGRKWKLEPQLEFDSDIGAGRVQATPIARMMTNVQARKAICPGSLTILAAGIRQLKLLAVGVFSYQDILAGEPRSMV